MEYLPNYFVVDTLRIIDVAGDGRNLGLTVRKLRQTCPKGLGVKTDFSEEGLLYIRPLHK